MLGQLTAASIRPLIWSNYPVGSLSILDDLGSIVKPQLLVQSNEHLSVGVAIYQFPVLVATCTTVVSKLAKGKSSALAKADQFLFTVALGTVCLQIATVQQNLLLRHYSTISLQEQHDNRAMSVEWAVARGQWT